MKVQTLISLFEKKKKKTGRVGKETDIGSVVLYLASRAGTYVNGQVVHVDGGTCLIIFLVFYFNRSIDC